MNKTIKISLLIFHKIDYRITMFLTHTHVCSNERYFLIVQMHLALCSNHRKNEKSCIHEKIHTNTGTEKFSLLINTWEERNIFFLCSSWIDGGKFNAFSPFSKCSFPLQDCLLLFFLAQFFSGRSLVAVNINFPDVVSLYGFPKWRRFCLEGVVFKSRHFSIFPMHQMYVS